MLVNCIGLKCQTIFSLFYEVANREMLRRLLWMCIVWEIANILDAAAAFCCVSNAIENDAKFFEGMTPVSLI